MIAISQELRPLTQALGSRVVTFDDLHAMPTATGSSSDFRLVQFTSGSTGAPKGVKLGTQQLMANIGAILNHLQLRPGDGSMSWLPLSHDMGLIGMLLAPLIGCGPAYVNGGNVGLMAPLTFVRQPRRWLTACSEWKSTITAAPPFALDLAKEDTRSRASLELSALRTCIVGAEPVGPSTLATFSESFSVHGLKDTVLTPAYGLAEMGVAVSIAAVDERWSSRTFEFGTEDTRRTSLELVSNGAPLPGYSVDAGASELEPVLVDGPSMFSGYSNTDRPLQVPLPTGDLGAVVEGEVFIAGRHDDVVIISGRKVYLADIDQAITTAGDVRPGRVCCVRHLSHHSLVVAAEEVPGVDTAVTARSITATVAQRAGQKPAAVIILSRGGLPRTASGKPRRNEVAERLLENSLPILFKQGDI